MQQHTLVGMTGAVAIILLLIVSSPCLGSAQGVSGAAQIDVTAQSLAAAGLTETETTVLLTRLEDCGSMLQQLTAAKVSLDSATTTASELAIALREGSADSQVQLEYLQAKSLIDQTRQLIEQIEISLASAAFEGLNATKAQCLMNWRSTKDLRVPSEFRVLSLTLAQWREIEAALRAEQRSIRLGEDVDEGVADLLASVRTNTEVIEAKLRLETQMPTMQAFLQSWAGG